MPPASSAPEHPVPDRPALVFLHALGSSRRAFDGVAARLRERFDVIGIDLPGFGETSATEGLSVAEMVGFAARRLDGRLPPRWLLAGHSMGGKVASVLAARVMAGEDPLFGLAGIVLLAGSPLVPEPMEEERRAEMLSWVEGGRPLNEDAIRRFIDANVGAPLSPEADALMRDDLARTAPEAWAAWLDRGSREDWSAEASRSPVPALILAGGADGDLGPDGQRATNARTYPRATLEVLEGAGHVLPLERTEAVADAILRFWNARAGQGPAVPPDMVRLIVSPRVSARTRSILAHRILATDPEPADGFLTAAQRRTLRALAERVVPQDGPPIDLAARVEAQIAAGRGDGWRPAILPPDREAYALALDALAGLEVMTPAEQDARIGEMAEGRFAASGLSGDEMAAWFEDVRTDLVRHWLAHPATMARIGFDGFANGGDGVRKQGYDRLKAGEREAWEPALEAAR